MTPPHALVSIVIGSYNHAAYLANAIDSALNQTYRPTEVIVVDDGSTDRSPQIIRSYGDSITAILKPNEGSDVAINRGFAASRGQVVCFLDSDDGLFPTAMECAVEQLRDPRVAKVQWPLQLVDTAGRSLDKLWPLPTLDQGDLREVVLRKGPYSYVSPPSSGNAWPRWFLDRVFPLEEMETKSGTSDAQLSMLAPLFGTVTSLPALGYYRVHSGNDYCGKVIEKLPILRRDYDRCCDVLLAACRRVGFEPDPEQWKADAWFVRLHRALDTITSRIPEGRPFVLLDNAEWMTPAMLGGRRRIPFPERDGEYGGRLAASADAIREIERLRTEENAEFLVIGWPSFWWLEHYADWREYLHSRFRCLVEDDVLILFDLRVPAPDGDPTRA